MANNRSSERVHTLLSGALYDDEGSAWECSISDISEGGARIKLESEVEPEMVLDLRIDKFNDVRQSKVMWKQESYAGLQFTAKIDEGKNPMSQLLNDRLRRNIMSEKQQTSSVSNITQIWRKLFK